MERCIDCQELVERGVAKRMLHPWGWGVYQDTVWVGMTELKQLAYRGLVYTAVCHIRRRKLRHGVGGCHTFYNTFAAWMFPLS